MNNYFEFTTNIKQRYKMLEEWIKANPFETKTWNPFRERGITVYTDLDDFESPYNNVNVRNYNELNSGYQEWIRKSKNKLMEHRTYSELEFADILKSVGFSYVEQPYFRINGKGYFLDFYLPQSRIAFELNGEIHRGNDKENYDFDRDYAFHAIGIRTIRITNRDLLTGDLDKQVKQWIELANEGVFDPALYFKRPNANKFLGETTYNQTQHFIINDTLRDKRFVGKKVLLKVDYDYLFKVLKPERYNAERMANSTFIDEFYDTIEYCNETVGICFTGDKSKMNKGLRDYVIEQSNKALADDDYDEVIDYKKDGEVKCYKYEHPGYRVVQYWTHHDTELDEDVYEQSCPYKMFFPYLHDLGNMKYRSKMYRIGVSDFTCEQCEYCKGIDRDKREVKCMGYVNNGSKNIYDHISLKGWFDEDGARTYQGLKSYIGTDEYKEMMRRVGCQLIQKENNKKKKHNL